MIDISKLKYRAYLVLADGRRLDFTDSLTALTWNECEGEISTRITATIANATFDGKPLSSTIVPNTAIIITVDSGAGEKEVTRGTIIEWGVDRSNGSMGFSVVAYDDLFYLQQSQDDRYISAGTGTKAAITGIFKDWGIPTGEYRGPDKAHAKTIFKSQFLSDIIMTLLDDAEKHGADHYIVRAESGKVAVVPVGSNTEVYHLADDSSVSATSDKITTQSMVTRIKVMGVEDKDGKASVEAVVNGHTEYGIRQRIYSRSSDDSLEAAKTAAQKILDDSGEPKRTSTISGPDVPYIRKGDIVHLDTEILNGYFYIKSISHTASTRSMTMRLTPWEFPSSGTVTNAPEGGSAAESHKVGDIVEFRGGSHYVSSTAASPASTGLGAGKAKITQVAPNAPHPWHLVTQEWSKTHVYGWVDNGSF